MTHTRIPVVDLFAGPGGLGEGFSSVTDDSGRSVYKVALSVECDKYAHQTLRLRSFYREFDNSEVPKRYFDYVRNTVSLDDLKKHNEQQWSAAEGIAVHAALGEINPDVIDKKIEASIREHEHEWVLIGGPPCQAYSLVGRAKTGKKANQKDKRHFLYREYLRILQAHRPAAFVMENVKGLLSAQVKEARIIEQILNDLSEAGYRLHALADTAQGQLAGLSAHASDFVVRCERYGVPQARHRLIIVGTRDDLRITTLNRLNPSATRSTVKDALRGLPSLRSTLSRRDGGDSSEAWANAIRAAISQTVLDQVAAYTDKETADVLRAARDEVDWSLDAGGRFVRWPVSKGKANSSLWRWYNSPKLNGACNHEARSHMGSDLGRYLFAASYAQVQGRSPVLNDFPGALLPNHQNVNGDRNGDQAFADRFRVQVYGQPSTTVVAHISKDGHYFIHPDPTQCRSLTVREAARLQTFPDDYFFEGPRTEQYRQVGNAVPPLLAKQIAEILHDALSGQSQSGQEDGGHDQQKAPQLEHVSDSRA